MLSSDDGDNDADDDNAVGGDDHANDDRCSPKKDLAGWSAERPPNQKYQSLERCCWHALHSPLHLHWPASIAVQSALSTWPAVLIHCSACFAK